MVSTIKHFYHTIITIRNESLKVVRFVERRCGESKKECKVLDAGCGNGRYLQLLSQSGFDVTGVDANPELVRRRPKAGLRCLTTEEFSRTVRGGTTSLSDCTRWMHRNVMSNVKWAR